jgi:hypothetical protein
MRIVLVVVSLCLTVAAQASEPRRRVGAQTVESSDHPAARLTFDKAFRYIGGQRFDLYGLADAEQHFFAEADDRGRIRRIYWVQFEGFLPTNDKVYEYDSPERVTIGGLQFVADTFAPPNTDEPERPGSDGAYARALLEKNGLKVPDEMLLVRLVHLTDATKRNELMIIYGEDLAGLGVKREEIIDGGAKAAQWPDLSKAIIERAQRTMTVTRSRESENR